MSASEWPLDTRTGWKWHMSHWHYVKAGLSVCGKFEVRIWGKPRKPILEQPPINQLDRVCSGCKLILD